MLVRKNHPRRAQTFRVGSYVAESLKTISMYPGESKLYLWAMRISPKSDDRRKHSQGMKNKVMPGPEIDPGVE
jgi:hypothetical protein